MLNPFDHDERHRCIRDFLHIHIDHTLLNVCFHHIVMNHDSLYTDHVDEFDFDVEIDVNKLLKLEEVRYIANGW